MNSRWHAPILAVSLIACGPAGAPPAPSRDACASDADCVLAPRAADAAAPCCNGQEMAMFSHAFVTWRDAYRASQCASVPCPDQPTDWPPEGCAREPRCVAARCTDACAAAAASP